MTTDRIRIVGLRVPAIIGVHRHERRVPQTLRVDIEFSTNAARAGASDRLADAVDYQAVARTAVDIIQAGKFQLIETAADRTARQLRDTFGLDCTITVTKPSALADAQNVSVTVTRFRET